MTDQPLDRELLIDLITNEVLTRRILTVNQHLVTCLPLIAFRLNDGAGQVDAAHHGKLPAYLSFAGNSEAVFVINRRISNVDQDVFIGNLIDRNRLQRRRRLTLIV